MNSAFHTVVSKLTAWAISLNTCFWRFLEIHWIKLIALLVMLHAVNEVAVTNMVSVILIVVCFPFPSLHGFCATILFLWTGLMTLCKMCFQLHLFTFNSTVTCDPNVNETGELRNFTWMGLAKVDNFELYSMPLGTIMAVCVCWHAITYRQRQFYNGPQHRKPPPGIVFPHVTVKSLDHGLWNLLMFIFNYGFYKLGLEICFCTTVITSCLRADAFSCLYLVLLLVFLFMSRELCARLWLPYLILLATLIPIQYAGCVGLPPWLCWTFPWITADANSNFLRWLFLPGDYGSPPAKKLTADFFQFAAVALQYQVFRIEQSDEAKLYGGGSNEPVLDDLPPRKNERDFVGCKQSYLDYLRHLIFYWSYWVSLAVVFSTGITWITLFCMGYMIISVIYLWMGQNVMLLKRVNLLKSWNVIVGYNFFVILAKCSLQLLGCIVWQGLPELCWLLQLFGIRCMDPMSWSHFNPPAYQKECAPTSSGLHWDVGCFLFIIFQRKIFMTRSFSHVVLDLTVQSQFVSRGACLINRKLMSTISEQAAREQYLIRKVREKLDLIQRRQAALGRNTANITEHYIMLRSGDYYLFEGDPEQEDEELAREFPPAGADKKRKRSAPSSPTRSVASKPLNTKRTHYKSSASQPTSPHGQAISLSLDGQPRAILGTDPHLGRMLIRNDSIVDTLPNLEPSVLRVLSNYSDPHNIIGSEDASGHNIYQAYFANVIPTTYDQGRAMGHRRLRSHPEYPREQSLLFNGTRPTLDRHPDSPAPGPLGPVSRRANVDGLARTRELIRRPQKPPPDDVVARRKPYQTHRRIFSASSALAHFDNRPGPSQPNTGRLTRITKRPPPLQPSHEASNLDEAVIGSQRMPDESERKSSAPSYVTSKAVVKSPPKRDSAPDVWDHATQGARPDKHLPVRKALFSDDEDAFGYWDSGDADDDEDYDDANPSPFAPRLNPFQLLNRAMECGPYSAVRQYRRSLLLSAPSQRDQVTQVEPTETVSAEGTGTGPLVGNDVPVASTSQSILPVVSQSTLHNATRERVQPSVIDTRVAASRAQSAKYTNQSNRNWFPGRRAKRYKLSTLASFRMDDGLSESLLQPDVEAGYSQDQQLEYFSGPPDPVSNRTQWPTRMRISVTDAHPEFYTKPATTEQPVDHTLSEPMLRFRSVGSLETISMDSAELASRDDDLSRRPSATKLFASTTRSQDGCWSNFKAFCVFCYVFFITTLDSLIRFLNRLTKQYRRIRHTIEQEKSLFKKKVIDFSENHETSVLDIETAVLQISCSSPKSQLKPSPQVNALFNNGESDTDGQPDVSRDADRQEHDQREKAFRRSRSRAFLLLIALGNLGIVYSEWFCYLLLIVNHMRTSALLSLPYPLTVFLWGMLSVPRPTKTFWIFLITYTEVVTVIKYIFQFQFIHFNDPMNRPADSSESLWLPRLLGIDKHHSYALIDLIQLIALFLHRGFLKNDGLWRDHTEAVHDLQLVAQTGKANSRYTRKRKDRDTDVVSVDDRATVNSNNVAQDASRTPVPIQLNRSSKRSWNPFAKLMRFYHKMTDPRYNKKVDVYIYMFLCEFISFWIIIFGYVSFGPSTGMGDNAFEFIKSNRIPLPFISMLLVQFVFIIVDRGLFLRKQVLGKFIFQIFHVLIIHIWLFFILPYITRVRFTTGIAPQLLYLIKCIYFSLSAYQIRSGYPFRILGNFLTKNYNYLNLILFKGYMLVPFLYELRNVMDWMWTNSALSLYHWMELEDIYCKIFVLKCWRRSEIAYPTPRGVNRPAGKKSLVGGLLLAFFFLCFWGPMTLSSFIGATFDFNPPALCTFSLSFGGFPAIFEFDSREGNILYIEQDALLNFTRCHEKDQQTVGFLNNFEASDLRYITIDGFSGNLWAITPPSYDTLLTKLGDPDAELVLHFFMQCRRLPKEIQTSQTSVDSIFSRNLSPDEKQQLLSMLKENGSVQSVVTLDGVLPRYFLLRKDRLRSAFGRLGEDFTRINVSFSIRRGPTRPQAWWELRESMPSRDLCFESLRGPVQKRIGSTANVLSLVTFNERVSDSLFGKVFSNYGIIGMYAAYIFLANRLLRTIYSNISYVISFEELPHVDRILRLCDEIYLVRENKLLLLEEQLVAKLFFLYRSSETMIKWTRHPKHLIDKFTDNSNPTNPPNPTNPTAVPRSHSNPAPPLENDSHSGNQTRMPVGQHRSLDQNESNSVVINRGPRPGRFARSTAFSPKFG